MKYKANLMRDCGIGTEQKQPVRHGTEQHRITQWSIMVLLSGPASAVRLPALSGTLFSQETHAYGSSS